MLVLVTVLFFFAQTPEDQLNRALIEAESGQLAAAQQIADELLVKSLSQVGFLFLQAGRYQKAQTAFQQGLEISGDDQDSLLGLILARLHSGQMQGVRQAFESLKRLDPQQAWIERLEGVVLLASRQYQEAEDYFRSRLASEGVTAAPGLIFTHLLQKDIDKAKKVAAELIQSRGDSAPLRIFLGRALRRAAEASGVEFDQLLDQSEAHIRRAIELDPSQQGVHYQLALTLLKRSSSEAIREAVAALRREADLHPNHYLAQHYLGLLLLEDRKYSEAISPLQTSLEVNPENPHARLLLARCHYSMGNLDAALQHLEILASLPEAQAGTRWDQSRVHYLLGRVLMKKGERKRSEYHLGLTARLKREWAGEELDNLQASMRLGTADQGFDFLLPRVPVPTGHKLAEIQAEIGSLSILIATAYRVKARVLAGTDLEATAVNLRLALEWDPSDRESQFNLAVAQTKLGRFVQAADTLLQYLEVESDSSPARDLLRNVLGQVTQTSDPHSALKALQDLSHQYPDEADLYLAQVEALRRLGRPQEAREVMRQYQSARQKP